MKILLSIGTLGLGGAEKQAVWLANKLSEKHEITLLTYHGGARQKDLSPKVIWRTIFEIHKEENEEEFNSKEFVVEERAISESLFKEELFPSGEADSAEFNSVTSISRLTLLEEKVKTFFKNFPLTLKMLRYIYIKSMPIIQIVRSGLRVTFELVQKYRAFCKRFMRFTKEFRSVLTWKNFSKRVIKVVIKLVAVFMTRFLRIMRKPIYYLTLPRLRQNIQNQTYVFIRARRVVKEVRPDLIITFLFHDTLNVGLAGLTQINRPRLIVGRRSPIGYGDSSRNYYHRLVLRIIYKFADLAVSNSIANIESAINDGIKEGKIRVIENFVANNNLSEVQTTKEEPLEILCIANFHWYKNHDGLLRAVATIPNHEKRFRITFVGDGPLLGDIQQLASELEVSCEFRGFIDNPSSEIPFFQAIILVSHVEGSSNALLEGLICGIPAVVSEVGSAQELLSQGAPLILCDSYDFTSIANALIQLIDNYETLRIEARDFSKILSQHLSEDAVFKKWQEAIRVVTSS